MMKNLIKNYLFGIVNYKKIFVSLIGLEIMRGIFIIISAWLMMCLVNSQLFNSEMLSPRDFIILFAAFCLRILIENSRTKKFSSISQDFQKTLRRKLHKIIFTASTKEIHSGEILTLMFEIVESFNDLIRRVLPNVLTIAILIPLILIVTAATDPLTALIFLLTLPIAPFLLYLIGHSVSMKNQKALAELSQLNGDFKELLSAITTLKIFRQAGPALQKLKATSEQSARTTLDVLKLAFVSAFALELMTTLSIALIAVTIGLRLIDDNIDFEAAFFLLLLAPEFYAPIRQIGVAFHSAIKAKDAAASIKNFELKNIKAARSQINIDKFTSSDLALRLINVSFTYLNKKTPTLKNLNLAFKVGVVTAVIGESGCGKSTLLKILAGINEPTEGKFLFNADYPDIAYVPQNPHLFKATLLENIYVFKTTDEIRAKKILGAVGLNLNPDTEINSLSRGQLQRIGLARALIKNSPILILDEPTAGLDLETEEKILRLLEDYRRNHTIIIATHRRAVIEFADYIISLDS